MKEKQNRKGGRQLLEERAEAIAAPIAEQFGIYIYDVEYVKEGQDYYLNVYIDKEGGVTINDCESVSRILSDQLDEADLIKDPYTLIVSSPGLGRALTRDRHLRQSIGQEVEIHLYRPHSDFAVKDLRGELIEFDDDTVTILSEPPVPPKEKGRKKGKSKGKGREKEETAAQDIQTNLDEQKMQDGMIRLCIERKEIASVRLAFDF